MQAYDYNVNASLLVEHGERQKFWDKHASRIYIETYESPLATMLAFATN